MASLRVPHSWQPGLQVDTREGCAAEHAGGRAGLSAAPRQQQRCSASFSRSGGRCRSYARRGSISNAVKACGACGGSTGVGDHAAESIDEPREKACRLLRVEGAEELQDLIASLILSECVYKKLELDEAGVAAKVAEFVGAFPPGWVQLQAVQLSLSGIPQHYLIATSPTSMYVAFMGTKQFQDILADANLLHTPVWAESARLAADRQSIPAAHRGFLERARAIHVEQLYELAVSRGLRLVLCGHSLGGAVAKLCTLRLLRELPDWPRPRVRCIAFATPAVGNAALAELVENAGWASHFSTYYLPEDQLVRLISFSQARTTSTGSSSGGGATGARGERRSSGRTERRRRALEHAALRSPAGGFSGVAADVTVTLTSPVASTARLDEATLGGLRAGVAAPVMAAGAAVEPPEPRAHLSRVPSASSITSASSCASAATSGAGPGGNGSGSSTCSSRSLLRDCSLGGASADGDGVAVVQRESPASPAHSNSSLDSTRSSCDDGGPPLHVAPPPSCLTAAVAAAQGVAGFAIGSSSSSFTESMDEDQAGVALAMEEILAPGLDALEAAAAAGVALSGQPPADLAAAQREALYGNASGSWGLRLALGRKRVMRRLRRFAAKAHIPLPKALLPVSRYHTFGEQWFVTEEGALSPVELEVALRQQKVQEQQQQQAPQPQQAGTAAAAAAATATATSEGSRGFFSFHRMVAYRQRHSDLVARLVRSDSAAQGHVLHAPADAPLPPQPQTVGGSGGGGSFAAAPAAASTAVPHCPSVQLSDSLLPRISVQRAVLRGLLPEPPPAPQAGRRAAPDATARYDQPRADQRAVPVSPGGDGAVGSGHSGAVLVASAATAIGTVGTMPADRHSAAGGALVMGRILSWVRGGGGGGGGGLYRSGGSGRLGSADEPVRLDLELEGRNLQYCRKVSVALVRDGADVVAGAVVAAAVAGAVPAAGAATGAAPAGASSLAAGLAASAADGEAVAANAGAKRWVPFGMPRGGSRTAGPGSKAAAQQPLPAELVGAAAAGLAAANPSPSPSSQVAAPSTPPGPNPPAVTSAAAVVAATPAPATTTEVPCEVVQVLYAQPYSDEANPPPLHPVSLFRNTLHHFAGNLMRRCCLQSQGQVGAGAGGGLAGLAAAGAGSAACASVAALAGGGGTLAEGHGARGGHWQGFRFKRAFPLPSSDRSGGSATPLGSLSPAATGEDMEARGAWQLPGSTLAGAAAASSVGGSGRSGGGAAAAAVPAHTVVEMPSRLLLRVTLPRSVARSLLDGTLPGRLVVSARSDFHSLSAVPVAVQRPRVAILGTSPYAASLVQAALSAPAALAAAGLDERAAAAGGGGAGAAVAGVAAWVPPPVAWALSAVRGATAPAVVRRGPAPAAAETGAAAATAQGAGGAHGPGSAAVSRGTAPGAVSVPGSGSSATGACNTPATAAASAASGLSTSGRFEPWWSQMSTHAGMPRLRARMGKLRWGIRQSLAAAAVGAAAASAAGVTGAAAAVGAAAVVASTVAAFSTDGGVFVLANAAVTLAAVVAAAAAAASAFYGGEGVVLVAAAASAAAMAFAAATSSGEGAMGPPPQHQQQQAATAKALATNGVTSRTSVRGMPAPLAAPMLAAPRPAAAPAAAANARRWVLRFGSRSASGQAGARAGAQARSGGGGGGGRTAAGTGGAPGAAGSGAGGAVRPVGRGWMLWWPGSPRPAPEDGAMSTLRATPTAQPPVSPATRWLSWPLPNALGQARGPMTPSLGAPRGAAAAAVAIAAEASAAAAGVPTAVVAAAALTAPAAATAAAQPLSPPTAPADSRRQPAAGWFPPTGAAQCRVAATRADAAKAAATTAAAAATGSKQAGLGGGGGSSGPAAAAVSLAQLRTGLLSSLRAGSGRTALPLPPGVLSDGLEICNMMVEPMRRTWGSGRAGAAAAAAGQHLLPLRPSGRAPPPSAVAAAQAPLAPVPVALLWRGRCQGPPAAGAASEPGVAFVPTTPPAAPAPRLSTLVAVPPLTPGGLPAPPRIDPRAAAAAALAALDGTAAAATAAAAAAAATALGVLPARDGCPELVGVAPFVAVHRMEEGLRRQLLQRGIWWRALLGGVVGALLRPVALVGLLGRLPGWVLMQALRRGNTAHGDGAAARAAAGAAAAVSTNGAHGGSNALAIGAAAAGGIGSGGGAERQPSDWGALLVVASCRDSLRVLRGRGMEALRARAAEAACPVVPVLLTCPESPPGRRAAAARTLAAACGVGPGEVRTVVLDGELLHSPAVAIPRADLADVWRRTAECEGAAELRAAVRGAVAAQADRQELQLQQQQQQQQQEGQGRQQQQQRP